MASIFSSFLGGKKDDNSNSTSNHSGGGNGSASASGQGKAGGGAPDAAQRQKERSQQLLMLVARIEGSSSLEQRREAATELAAAVAEKPAWDSESICAAFNANHIALLRSVVRDNCDEFDIVAAVLDIVLAATALPAGATGWTEVAQGSGGAGGDHATSRKFHSSSAAAGAAAGQQRTREQQRDHAVELISVLVDETPFLLGLLSREAADGGASTSSSSATSASSSPRAAEKIPFWVQYNVLQLLARIHAVDSAAFGRHLLQCDDGVQLLLSILNDTSNSGALRDECLALLGDITLVSTNHELQTILAFHQCFDTLFFVIRDEGGIASGSVVVRECITVMHNMLRQNHAAQRVFRENGNVAQLAQLLDTDVFVGASPVRGAPRDTEAQASSATLPRSAAETYATVAALVASLLRSADSNGEGPEIRAACVAAKLPQALVRAALETLPVGDGSYETEETQLLSTLALLVHKNGPAIDAVISAQVRQFGTRVDAAWLLMRMALSDSEPARANVAASLLTLALSAGTNCEEIAAKLLDGLERKPSTTSEQQQQKTLMKSGYVLAALAMASKPPSPTTWYIAGHLLSSCIMANPAAAAAIAYSPWPGSSSSSSSSTSSVAESSTSSSSSSLPFFLAYVSRTKRMIESRQTDIATNMAALFPILAWLRVCPQHTVPLLVSDPNLPMFFADWAGACRDGQHTPFMSAAILALCVLMYPTNNSSSSSSSAVAASSPALGVSREELTSLLMNNVTLARLQKTRDAVLDSDEWHRATRNPALASLPTVLVYDAKMCQMLTEVAGAMLQGPPTPAAAVAPAVEMNTDGKQQQQQQCQATATVDNNSKKVTAEQQHQRRIQKQAAEDDPFSIGDDGSSAPSALSAGDPFFFGGATTSAAEHHEQQRQPHHHQHPADSFWLQSASRHQHRKSDDSFCIPEVLQPPTDAIHGRDGDGDGGGGGEQGTAAAAQGAKTCATTQAAKTSAAAAVVNNSAPASSSSGSYAQQQQQQQLEQNAALILLLQQQLEEAQTQCSQFEQQLGASSEANDILTHDAARLESTLDSQSREVERLQRGNADLSSQLQQALQLLQARDDTIASMQTKNKLAEMALADVTRDKNELMLLVAEMGSELAGVAMMDAEITPIPGASRHHHYQQQPQQQHNDDLYYYDQHTYPASTASQVSAHKQHQHHPHHVEEGNPYDGSDTIPALAAQNGDYYDRNKEGHQQHHFQQQQQQQHQQQPPQHHDQKVHEYLEELHPPLLPHASAGFSATTDMMGGGVPGCEDPFSLRQQQQHQQSLEEQPQQETEGAVDDVFASVGQPPPPLADAGGDPFAVAPPRRL